MTTTDLIKAKYRFFFIFDNAIMIEVGKANWDQL